MVTNNHEQNTKMTGSSVTGTRAPTYDVIVIGGGLAGTTAARLLAERGKTVLLLEASERLGGRTQTVTSHDGAAIDVGGQWLGKTQHRMLDLVAEFDLDLFQQYNQGKKHLDILGARTVYRGSIPKLSWRSLYTLHKLIRTVDRLAHRIEPEAPYQQGMPNNESNWDQLSLQTWLHNQTSDRHVLRVTHLAVNAVYACEPKDISLLHFLFYIRSAGSFQNLLDVDGHGAQHYRVVGGTQQISLRQWSRATIAGAQLALNAPVVAVQQTLQQAAQQSNQQTVTVTTQHRDCRAKHLAKKVICAVAPPVAAKITWRADLPAARLALHQGMPMGRVIKCIVIYRKPFWREAGFTGEIVSDQAPFQLCFDDTPDDARHGALVVFLLADQAAKWQSQLPTERRQAILMRLAEIYGTQAFNAVDYVEKDWLSDPYSEGCYAGLMPPELYAKTRNIIRQPCGHIHWAGTETATEWNGYMEGAVQSGERVADEICPP